MSANHHIHLTTQIAISITTKYIKEQDLKQLLPQTYREDFELVYREDYVDKNIVYPQGIEKTYLLFALKKEHLDKVQPFIVESLLIAKNILNRHRSKKGYDDFIELFKQLDIKTNLLYDGKQKEIEEFANKLRDIDINEFTTYTRIQQNAVYYGFPQDLKKDDRVCSIIGFDIVYSYFDFQEDVDETIEFYRVKEQIKKERKYPILSKYIYHLGY